MAEDNVFVHIGLTKTASSLLQDRIFRSEEGINYIGKWEGYYPEWLIEWSYLYDIAFEQEADRIASIFYSKIDHNKPNMLSSESFGRFGGVYVNQALRIKKIVPSAKIIIVLRHPIELIKSFYKYAVKHFGFWKPLDECIDWARTPYVFFRRKPIIITDFHYDELINYYNKIFLENNVCVLKYEMLVENSIEFFSKLGTFIGVDWNVHELSEKQKSIFVNKSPNKFDIIKLRLNNFKELTAPVFSELLLEQESKNIFEIFSSEQLLSSRVEKKIKAQLKGKCYGYI